MFVRYDSKESYVKIIRWIYVPSFLAFGYNSLYPKKERKGAFFMLNYFNDQIGLYVLAGVFSICLFGKLVTNNIYKRMIKQSKDLLVTKDKRLRLIAESYASYSKTKGTMKNLPVFIFILVFTISRILSLFLIALVPSSVNRGLLYIFSSKENKKSLLIYAFLLSLVFIFLTYILMGYKFIIILLLILVIISIILIKYFNKVFGGISGDLAGFSICIYEISALLLYSISRLVLWN